MRWHYCDPPLLWLFPITYAVHIVEEHALGFTEWTERATGYTLSPQAPLVYNAIGLVLMIVGVRLATRHPRHDEAGVGPRRWEWIAVALAVAVLINASLHVGGALMSHAYSPGLGTAIVMWLPLGFLTLVRAVYQAPRRTLIAGAAAGAATQVAVGVIIVMS